MKRRHRRCLAALGSAAEIAHYAGEHRARREEWLSRARFGELTLRSAYLGFAKSAHRAYLQALIAAFAAQRHHIRRAREART